MGTARQVRLPGVLILTLALSACGFQLRGADSMPDALAPLSLSCSDNVPGSLCGDVRDQLRLYGLLAGEDETPGYRLELRDYSQDRRASAISDRAAAAEYELDASVALMLNTADDIPLLAQTRISSRETYRADETEVLAGEREQQSVEDVVRNRLAQQVVRRLSPFTEQRIERIRAEHKAESSE